MSRTVARGAALVALALVIVLAGWLLFLRGAGGTEYTLLFENAGPAGRGQRRAGRRPPRRRRDRHQPHRRQPGGGQDRRRGAVRAAARGYAGDGPADVAVGDRQPLRRAQPRAGRRRGARRGGDAADDVHDLGGRPRPADQHVRRAHARGPARRRRGLRHAVPGQGARGGGGGRVLQPAALHLAPPDRRADGGRGEPDGVPRRLLAARHRARRPPDRAGGARRQRERDRGRGGRGERRPVARARPAADDAAARQHDVRQPARDARRPRRAGRGVQARDARARAVPARAAAAGRGGAADGPRPEHDAAPAGARATTSSRRRASCRRSSGPRRRRSRTAPGRW